MDDITHKFKLDESDVERAVENIVKGLSSVQQAALKAQVDIKAAQDEQQKNLLDGYKRVKESQDRTIELMSKKFESLTAKTTQETEKQATSFIKLFTKLKSGLSLIGSLTGLGTLAAIIGKIGSAVSDMVGKFAATAEGKKALEGISLQWAKMKAVAQDFLENALKKIIPILNVVLPYIEKGFRQVTGVVAGIVAFYKASYENVFNGVKILFNDILIGYNLVKEKVLGDKGAGEKVKELRAENAKLENSFVDAGQAAKDAYNEQIKSADQASANAKVATEETKKGTDALKKLREEYKKLREELAEKAKVADLNAIIDPFVKINTELSQAIKEITDKVAREKEIASKLKIKFNPQIEIDAQKSIDDLRATAKEKIDALLTELTKFSAEEIANFDLNTKDTRETKFKNDLIRDVKTFFEIPDSIIQATKKIGIKLFQNLRDLGSGELPTNKSGINLTTDAESNRKQNEVEIQLEADKGDKITKITAQSAKRQAEINEENRKKELEAFEKRKADLKRIAHELAKVFGSINDIVTASIQSKLDENQKLIDSIHSRVESAQAALDKEVQLQNDGAANNVETKRRELDELKKQEKAAQDERIALQKKALEQQLIIDELSQASTLATTVPIIFKKGVESGTLIVGIVSAIAAIASMFALFASFKAKAKSLASSNSVKAFTGGALEDYQEKSGWVNKNGRTDKRGGRGHRVEDSDLVLGGYEFVTNEDTSQRHGRFLEAMNQGKYDGMDLWSIANREAKASRASREQEIIDRKAQIAAAMKKKQEDDEILKRMKAMGDTTTGNAFLNNKRKYILSAKRNANLIDHHAIIKELREGREALEKQQKAEYVTVKQMQEMFDKHAKEMKKAIDNKEVVMPLTGDTKGYRLMKPELVETIWFE